MNRIDRLQAIITILQSKRVVKAEELAKRFDISLRTVYRDMRALEEGGVPIGAEAGVGYFITEGYHLPPVMFTHEEARAMLLAGKFVEKLSDEPTQKHFHNALTKVRAVIDQEKKDELEGLENKILINPFQEHKRSELSDLRLEPIKQALTNNLVLQLEYASRKGEETKGRVVEPLGICYYYSSWHLIAYCRLRKDYRDFRLDRIKELKILRERFSRARHPSLKEYMDRMISETELVPVTIAMDPEIARYIQDSKYSMGLLSETRRNDKVEMTFATYSYCYFARWLLMVGDVEIISPQELKEEIKRVVLQLSNKYLP
ncbi:MAG TPA: YafY family protein [Cytophagaceae bacterium]